MEYGSAVILDPQEVREVFELIDEVSRMPARDNLLWRLSFRGALRVAEMAQLTVDAMLGSRGEILDQIRIAPHMTKGSRGRVIPMHPEIREAFEEFMDVYPDAEWVAISPRDGAQMRPATLAAHFDRMFDAIGQDGCTSHTGRATCITEMARFANLHGGSLRDVQHFAGHKHLETTARYLGISGALPDLVRALGTTSNKEGRLNHGLRRRAQQQRHARTSKLRQQQHEEWTSGIFAAGQPGDRSETHASRIAARPAAAQKLKPRRPRRPRSPRGSR